MWIERLEEFKYYLPCALLGYFNKIPIYTIYQFGFSQRSCNTYSNNDILVEVDCCNGSKLIQNMCKHVLTMSMLNKTPRAVFLFAVFTLTRC